MKYLNLTVATLALLALPMTASADDAAKNPRVKLSTTLGDIVVELDAEKAPITVKNFLSYVNDGFYEGTIFHRVIPDFLIQAGGYDINDNEKKEGLKPPIKLESQNGLENVKYSIAMARQPQPDTASSQFFINSKDNTHLNYQNSRSPGYAVFGKVVEGQDVVDKIRTTECVRNSNYPFPGAVTPKVPVVIKKATVIGAKASAEKPDAKEPAEKKDE